MSTYRQIKSSRRLIWAGILVGYALAIGLALANLGSEAGTVLSAAAFFAALSLPSSLALASLDRRPALLTMAAMAALVQGALLLGSVVGVLEVVPATLWYLASQRRPRPATAPRQATWMRPLLAAATLAPLLVMFFHLDPLCVVSDPDGTVVRTYVEEGAPSGWEFGLGSYSTGSSDAGPGEITSCTSNRIVPWEAGASLFLSSLYLVLVVRLWPTAARLPAVSGRRA
ncbi:MAG TPA: hypothetical protein VK969_01185 [Acidimicrobiia bacterium]|nr:hypothetical protein [Acidimicrobiia bacterium]